MTDQQECKNCDSQGWVCENHPDKPWDGASKREDACVCGPGMPCDICNPDNPPRMMPGAIVLCSVYSDGKMVH